MEQPLTEITLGAPTSFGATIQDMVLNADPIVKGVMLLLVLASVICLSLIHI